MENNQHKQNDFKSLFIGMQRRNEIKALFNRMQRRNEIKEQLISILQSEENLAIEDIRKKIGLNRNTLNYWINTFEKEKWLHRKSINCEGKEKRGNPKTLVLDKKFIEWQETLKRKNWESYEERELENIIVDKILREIAEQQSQKKQHQKLIELFKQFEKDNYGAKFIFLLYGDFVKINYKLSLTEKGKKALEKIKKKK